MLAESGLKWLDRIAAVFAVIGGTTIVVLVGITVVSVFWRYILNDPIFGLHDVSRMALSVVAAGSIAYGARRGAHVHVDVLQMVAGRRITRYTDVIARLAGILILALLSWALWEEGVCGFDCGNFTDNLEIIHTSFYRFLSASMALYAAILVLELIAGLTHFDAPVDPNAHD